MNTAKYAQLLSDATALNTTLSFNSEQITGFTQKCVTTCNDINAKIDSTNIALDTLTTAELSKPQVQALHSMQAMLGKCAKALKQDVEKPILQYRKSLEKIEAKISKITAKVSAQVEPCAFDLTAISLLITQAKSPLTVSKQKLDICFKELAKSQTKLATTENKIKLIDLPSTIEHVTQCLDKISQDLSSLSLQIASQPETRLQYQKEFSPLRKALSDLQRQSLTLAEEEDKTVTSDLVLKL